MSAPIVLVRPRRPSESNADEHDYVYFRETVEPRPAEAIVQDGS